MLIALITSDWVYSIILEHVEQIALSNDCIEGVHSKKNGFSQCFVKLRKSSVFLPSSAWNLSGKSRFFYCAWVHDNESL